MRPRPSDGVPRRLYLSREGGRGGGSDAGIGDRSGDTRCERRQRYGRAELGRKTALLELATSCRGQRGRLGVRPSVDRREHGGHHPTRQRCRGQQTTGRKDGQCERIEPGQRVADHSHDSVRERSVVPDTPVIRGDRNDAAIVTQHAPRDRQRVGMTAELAYQGVRLGRLGLVMWIKAALKQLQALYLAQSQQRQ